MEEVLNDRKKKILKAIIKTYMETGEPVGSRTISKYTDLNVSSATIRNEMSDLTDLGYIIQPHTSAGRIPSDKGYRLYVDELMKEKESEVAELRELVLEKTDKMEKVLKQAEGSPQFGMGLPAGEGTGGRIGGIHRQHQPHMADAQ